MKTRLLESRDVRRVTVKSAEMLESSPRSIFLKTQADVKNRAVTSSADPEAIAGQKGATARKPIEEGRLRIDVISDNILRVRYAPGTNDVPENRTPMLAGEVAPPVPTHCTIESAKAFVEGLDAAPWLKTPDAFNTGEAIRITTGEIAATVMLNPYRIEIRDARDPNGRIICGIGGPEKDNFTNWDAYNTGVCRSATDDLPIATECFDLRCDECVYGLGERFIKLNKVGQTIDLNTMDGIGVTTPRAYKNVPFFVTTGGYGVFFNHAAPMTVWVGSRSIADIQVAAAGDAFLDYFVIVGDIKRVLRGYTDLTGHGTLPPKWTFGYWQSKFSYQSAEETLEIARRMREHEIPCDVIHLDTHWFKQDWFCDLEFSPERFPDPKKYFDELARMGIKVSLWQLPYIPEGSKLFDDLKAVDGFVKNKDGGIYNCGVCFVKGFKGVVGVVDYTNPRAVKVHQDYFRRLFRLGAKVIKTDFGEAAPADGIYHDGTPGHRAHNLYPLHYNRAIFDVTKQETGDGVVWARSGWAGSQRYPIHWGGDSSPNWFNLCPQIEGGLAFGLSGFQFWSQDIGGFCGTTNDRLLIRWLQVGMFCSHSRIHGTGDRELYKFAPETMRICREFLRLRYRLMPYIFGQAMKCVEQSLPMLRALVIEYPEDRTTHNLGDEFLFGDDLLVAPIYDEGTRRRVYLPRGTWTDWWTHERIPGERWIEVQAPIERIPLYIREGAMIPLGPVMNYVDEKPTDRIELFVAPFEKDGETRIDVPVNGKIIQVRYLASDQSHTISVGAGNVEFDVKTLGPRSVNVRQTEI